MQLAIVLFYSCKHTDELIKLQLMKTYCLPLLTYCVGAMELPKYKVNESSVCWNKKYSSFTDGNR